MDSTTGAYTVSGTATQVNADLAALTFNPASGQFGTTTFSISDTNWAGLVSNTATASVSVSAPVVPPTIKTNPLPVTVAEGQTTTNLYQTVLQDVQDANPNAQVSITSLGLSNTMGFAYLDQAHGLLTYTADGDQPSAKQPQDSFTYTASDQFGQQVTGTVAVIVTGANETTQVGTAGNDTLTASRANTRLIGGGGNDTLNANAAGTRSSAGRTMTRSTLTRPRRWFMAARAATRSTSAILPKTASCCSRAGRTRSTASTCTTATCST